MPDNAFLYGFLGAALWAEHANEAGDSFESLNYDRDDLSAAALKTLAEECQDFQALAAEELKAAQARGKSLETLGADFYFTRCGHGTGYWDRGLGELGEALTEKAETYSSINLYLSDDGKIEAQ